MELKYNIINSNSKGNAIVFNDYLLMDCGVTFTKLKPYLKNIKIVCLTHLWLHFDHFKKTTIKKLAFEKPTIKWICRDWLVEELVKLNISKKNIYVLKDRKTYDFGLFNIKPIETYHDVPNTSYLVDFKPYTLYYATDTCSLPDDECLKGLNLYCVEANYKQEILDKHIKECQDNDDEMNKLIYLDRVRKTHLSYEKANDFLIKNMGNESQFIYVHESNINFDGIE